MSDYQDCVLLEKTAAELVINATLIHPDAPLPNQFERASVLSLVLAALDRSPLDLTNETLLNEEADQWITRVTLEQVKGASAPSLEARYRIEITPKLSAALAQVKAKKRWSAAAWVPVLPRHSAEVTLSQLMKLKASLKVDSRTPQGSVQQRVDRLRRLLVAPPHPKEKEADTRLRGLHILPMLAGYGPDAVSAAEEVCTVLLTEAEAAPTLAQLGDPQAIGPIGLALAWVVPRVSAVDQTKPHHQYHFVQNMLTALGWFGPAARPWVESILNALKPAVVRQELALAFARWRVFDDDSQKAAMIALWKKHARGPFHELTSLLAKMVYGGPVPQLGAVIDAVGPSLSGALAIHEKQALKRLAATAPKQTPRGKGSRPGKESHASTRRAQP